MSVEMLSPSQEHDQDNQAVVKKAEAIVAAEVDNLSENTVETNEQALTSDEQANISKLDSSVMNPDRLTHLRTIFQGDMKRGRTEADAMTSVSASLTNTGGIGEYLPTKSTSDKYNEHADRIFQSTEKAMRLNDKEFKDYVDALKSPEDSYAHVRDFAKVDQKVYSNGAKHIYATNGNGKKVHLSQDAVLDAYGYSAKEAKEARKADKAEPTETKETKQNGVYGYQGKDLVNHGIDVVGSHASGSPGLLDEQNPNYHGPVQPGMEIERARSNNVIPFEQRSTMPAIVNDGEPSDHLPVPFKAVSKEIDVVEPAAESEPNANLSSRLRNRWNELMNRVGMLAQGDVREALGNGEKLLNKKIMIGAAAVVGAGILYWANNKNGWGIDVNPFDGDGLDVNPLNNDSGSVTPPETAPADTPTVSLAPIDNVPQGPESVMVHVDPGEGTSHIARDQLGIKFDNKQQWNRFNAATNPLFENVDGMYRDAASGELRIGKPGNLQVPQSILDEMQRVATEIKTGS